MALNLDSFWHDFRSGTLHRLYLRTVTWQSVKAYSARWTENWSACARLSACSVFLVLGNELCPIFVP